MTSHPSSIILLAKLVSACELTVPRPVAKCGATLVFGLLSSHGDGSTYLGVP